MNLYKVLVYDEDDSVEPVEYYAVAKMVGAALQAVVDNDDRGGKFEIELVEEDVANA